MERGQQSRVHPRGRQSRHDGVRLQGGGEVHAQPGVHEVESHQGHPIPHRQHGGQDREEDAEKAPLAQQQEPRRRNRGPAVRMVERQVSKSKE